MKRIILFTILYAAIAFCSPLIAQNSTQDIGKQYFEMGEYFRWANAIDGNGDLPKALISYQKSAEMNYPDGIAAVGEMTEFGLGGMQKDELKAFALYKKAYEMGSGRACYCLARCYAYGIGCEVDYPKMISYLQKGVDLSDCGSFYWMGEMLYKGWGVEQSYEKAIPYFEKASTMGSASAKYYLGICYRNGYGVKKDEKKGKEYLETAAKTYSYADKEFKKAQPETMAAKKIKNKEYDSPQSVVKTKHKAKTELLDGEWTGYLSYYDWSGKTKLTEQEVNLNIETNGDQLEGTWEQDGASFTISGFNNQYGIVFNSGEYDCDDHYMGKVRLKITTGTFESFSKGAKTFLVGNISLFSITQKAPERPTYIVLSRKIKEKSAIITEEPVATQHEEFTPLTVVPEDSTSLQALPTAISTELPNQKSIVNQLQDNTIKSRVWPVPFNNQITVEYNLNTNCEVEIRLVAMNGKLVSVLTKEKRQAGQQTQNFEVSVKPGAYVLQIISADNKCASHVIVKK